MQIYTFKETKMPVLDCDKLINHRVTAIQNFHKEAGIKRAELDVSGGIDSAVMLALLVRAIGAENVTAVYQGINSSVESLNRAREATYDCGARLVEIDLTATFEMLVQEMVCSLHGAGYSVTEVCERVANDRTILGSIRSTLRAPVGRGFNRLTGNEDEDRIIRFYQKGGDGEVDTNPIAMLSKGEVFQLARALKVPASILNARPSPDLWGTVAAHSDEDEIKSYLDLKDYDVTMYSYVDMTTGKYIRVGLLERAARFLDRGFWQEILFDGNNEDDLDLIVHRAVAAPEFHGLRTNIVERLLRACKRVEKMTRHASRPRGLRSPHEHAARGLRSDMSKGTLLTDLYQINMAAAYFAAGKHNQQAVFHLYFRTAPFGGSYAVTAGLEEALRYLRHAEFSTDDIRYLRSLTGNDGKPLYSEEFLDFLLHAGPIGSECDVDAMPEGTVVFPNEPILRIRGPIWRCQIAETPLLNAINFPTLIATKASRICRVARGKPVMEFGLRRAQGPDGALTASRAAVIGGCAGTSNVLAAKEFDIKPMGTHAHSWVMSFDDEEEAFEKYAEAMPNNCTFLIDTYDTLKGAEKAARVATKLRASGHSSAVRLDSGDLLVLSKAVRGVLDAAGCEDVKIVASNDLDEDKIEYLETHGAPIDSYGVGTQLSTGGNQSALGGVYKLGAIKVNAMNGEWADKVKLSNDPAKTSNPGILRVRRMYSDGGWMRNDVIYDERDGIEFDRLSEDLLVPVMRNGKMIGENPSVMEIQARAKKQLASMAHGIGSDRTPYAVVLDEKVAARKRRLVYEGHEKEAGQKRRLVYEAKKIAEEA